jgi:hypothetical protein
MTIYQLSTCMKMFLIALMGRFKLSKSAYDMNYEGEEGPFPVELDLVWVIPCEIIQTGRSTIFKKIYILYTYFYIFSYFKNIF